MSLTTQIKHSAIVLGFDVVGVTEAAPLSIEHVEKLKEWLDRGYAGQMRYMRRNLEKRIDPALLLEGAKSVICVALNYHQAEKPDSTERPSFTGRVANYARYEDYHGFMKQRLRELAAFINQTAGRECKFEICVDSAPIAERSFAAGAGLGFIGKNHMLINPEFGPEIFLGEMITDLELQPDEPLAADCSGCNRCIDACPTAALRGDGQFDANRCISYLTIEHKGPIAVDLAEKIGDRIFGCDECVMACPWYSSAPACANRGFRHYNERAELDLGEILDLDPGSFDALLPDSPIRRPGLAKLRKNAGICLKNRKSSR